MEQDVNCPHCSETVTVEMQWMILRTRKKPPSVLDDFDKSTVCPECDEKFACKTDTPY